MYNIYNTLYSISNLITFFVKTKLFTVFFTYFKIRPICFEGPQNFNQIDMVRRHFIKMADNFGKLSFSLIVITKGNKLVML